MPAIEAHRLARSFGARRACWDVSFEVERGEVFGLLGPNGAGKTTTLRMLAGLTAPDAGSARGGGGRVGGGRGRVGAPAPPRRPAHRVAGLLRPSHRAREPTLLRPAAWA